MTMTREYIIPGFDYSDIIPQDQPYDPETEEILYGDDLRNGMIVLVSGALRDNDRYPTHKSGDNLLVNNRWCEVTRVRHEREEVGGEAVVKSVYFIALYPDETKLVRHSSAAQGWHVKKNSIPPVSEEDAAEVMSGSKTTFGVFEAS